MATLKKLKPEQKEALGSMNNLVQRYDGLLEQSKTETLKDSPEAIQYIDDVITRYLMIKKTSPATQSSQAIKEKFLSSLREHASELSILSFSKPAELTNRLNKLDLEPSYINKIANGIEQPGCDDDLLAILSSGLIATSHTLAVCAGSHHHSHPIATVSSYGSHYHSH